MSFLLWPFFGAGSRVPSGGEAEIFTEGLVGGGAALGSSSLGKAVRRSLYAVAGTGYRAARTGCRHGVLGVCPAAS